jgi:hypothetical protein
VPVRLIPPLVLVPMVFAGSVLLVPFGPGAMHPLHHLQMSLHLRVGPEPVQLGVGMDPRLDLRVGEQPHDELHRPVHPGVHPHLLMPGMRCAGSSHVLVVRMRSGIGRRVLVAWLMMLVVLMMLVPGRVPPGALPNGGERTGLRSPPRAA